MGIIEGEQKSMCYSAHHQRPLCLRPVVREYLWYFLLLVGEENGKEENEAKHVENKKKM